jgi:hypothetical protein
VPLVGRSLKTPSPAASLPEAAPALFVVHIGVSWRCLTPVFIVFISLKYKVSVVSLFKKKRLDA